MFYSKKKKLFNIITVFGKVHKIILSECIKDKERVNLVIYFDQIFFRHWNEILKSFACRITFICPMTFNSFPLDVQVCHFQVKYSDNNNKKNHISSNNIIN